MQFSEFVEKMQADEELAKSFLEVSQKQDADALIAFLADNGCETTMEEVNAVMTQGDEELSLDSLEGAAGGWEGWKWAVTSAAGAVISLGLGIAACGIGYAVD